MPIGLSCEASASTYGLRNCTKTGSSPARTCAFWESWIPHCHCVERLIEWFVEELLSQSNPSICSWTFDMYIFCSPYLLIIGIVYSHYMGNCLNFRFCSSPLWMRQGLPLASFPAALHEKDFVVPGENLLSHSERRNLTDLQETCQWLGGQGVPRAIFEQLTSTLTSFANFWTYKFR